MGVATGIAWSYRESRRTIAVPCILVLVALALNVGLYATIETEGFNYFNKAWSVALGPMIVWSVSWLGWQLVALWLAAQAILDDTGAA